MLTAGSADAGLALEKTVEPIRLKLKTPTIASFENEKERCLCNINFFHESDER
jgi:hypothetical protein